VLRRVEIPRAVILCIDDSVLIDIIARITNPIGVDLVQLIAILHQRAVVFWIHPVVVISVRQLGVGTLLEFPAIAPSIEVVIVIRVENAQLMHSGPKMEVVNVPAGHLIAIQVCG